MFSEGENGHWLLKVQYLNLRGYLWFIELCSSISSLCFPGFRRQIPPAWESVSGMEDSPWGCRGAGAGYEYRFSILCWFMSSWVQWWYSSHLKQQATGKYSLSNCKSVNSLLVPPTTPPFCSPFPISLGYFNKCLALQMCTDISRVNHIP